MNANEAIAMLERAGVPTPRVDVSWLRRLASPDRFDELVNARAGRRPLQHLLGTVGFRTLELRCDGRALVP